MKRLLLVVVACGLGWTVYSRHHRVDEVFGYRSAQPSRQQPATSALPTAGDFSCDGRTYCAQMTSCAEATYFLLHCPNTKMDGDHDGVPCERQWCGER